MSTINQILAHIRSSGVVRPCNFQVNVFLPQMFFRGSGALVDYFSELGVTTNDSHQLTFLCEAARLPGKAFATIDNRAYGPQYKTPYLPSYSDTEEVALTFRLTRTMQERKLFDAWLNNIADPFTNDFNFYKEYISTIEIIQLDQEDNPVYGVRLLEAYPLSIQGNELDMGANDSYHKMQVAFTYRKWEPLYFTNQGTTTWKLPTPLEIFKNVFSFN